MIEDILKILEGQNTPRKDIDKIDFFDFIREISQYRIYDYCGIKYVMAPDYPKHIAPPLPQENIKYIMTKCYR